MILLSAKGMKKLLKKLMVCIGLNGSDRLIAFICGSEALPRPLTPEEEAEAIRLAAEGDNKAKQTLIERNFKRCSLFRWVCFCHDNHIYLKGTEYYD